MALARWMTIPSSLRRFSGRAPTIRHDPVAAEGRPVAQSSGV
jgi:hypothetical protein